ncbi:MAG: RHS repeat protein [Propionibacteriaceae bacterium]|nr:RHS repeat protein [Propionibacteriaceae bacterium]
MIKIDNTSTLPISYGYDADGRHASTTQRSHQTTTGYDGAGNITASTDELGNTTHYIYTAGGNDQLDQLTGVTYTDGTTASYSYDQAGNRTSQTAAGTTTHYSYDDASQLVGIDGVTVSHDQAGNVTSIGSTSYDWDWLGRMVKITSPAGTANYSYDGDNLRVQATGDTAATGNLLYDRQTDAAAPQLIADTNGSYTWTPAGQLSQQIGNTTSYTLADALGSTRALTDSSGAVTATVDYDVYGNVRNQTGTWGPYGYTAGIQTGSLVTSANATSEPTSASSCPPTPNDPEATASPAGTSTPTSPTTPPPTSTRPAARWRWSTPTC